MSAALDAQRDFYARYMVASAGSSSRRLVDAFRDVPRERHVGAGPWLVWTAHGYVSTDSSDPAFLYQDLVVGLMPEKKINNGQPALHAKCLAALDPMPGERVVHVGAGTGYYRALLRHLVGDSGFVEAYEIEPELAARARSLLAHYGNVTVRAESASARPMPQADVVYVNAGVTHIDDAWLDALGPGGRLVVPLTPDEGYGGMLMVKRLSGNAYEAQVLARVSFIPCEGNRRAGESAALAAAFEPSPGKPVRSLRRKSAPDASAWYAGDGWWLSTDAP